MGSRFTVKEQEVLPVSFNAAKYFTVLQNKIYKPSSFAGSMFQKNQRHEKSMKFNIFYNITCSMSHRIKVF